MSKVEQVPDCLICALAVVRKKIHSLQAVYFPVQNDKGNLRFGQMLEEGTVIRVMAYNDHTVKALPVNTFEMLVIVDAANSQVVSFFNHAVGAADRFIE
ncbi:hypothetical protein D3C73_1419120 [compost metagenome]